MCASRQSLGLYRRILRLGRRWQPADPTAATTERTYIAEEARRLFEANRTVRRALCIALEMKPPIFKPVAVIPNSLSTLKMWRPDSVKLKSALSWVRRGLGTQNGALAAWPNLLWCAFVTALHYRNPYPRMVRCGTHLPSAPAHRSFAHPWQPCVGPGAVSKGRHHQRRQERLRQQSLPSYMKSYNVDSTSNK